MEKLKIKISKLLPRAASAVTFLSPSASPSPSPRKNPAPLAVSLIPAEARRKPRHGSSFDTREPSSPKVSCLGQVNNNNNKPKSKPKPKQLCSPPPHQQEIKSATSRGNLIVKILGGQRKGSKKDGLKDSPEGVEKVPSLGLLKRFECSGRGGVLLDFEWKAHVAVVGPDCKNGCVGEERQRQGNGELEVVVVPIEVSNGNLGVKSKKQVSLWKRRNVAPPLLLHM